MARPRARVPRTCRLPTPFAMRCPCFVFAGEPWHHRKWCLLVIRAGAEVWTRRPNEVAGYCKQVASLEKCGTIVCSLYAQSQLGRMFNSGCLDSLVGWPSEIACRPHASF
jgi:hypothetical protein